MELANEYKRAVGEADKANPATAAVIELRSLLAGIPVIRNVSMSAAWYVRLFKLASTLRDIDPNSSRALSLVWFDAYRLSNDLVSLALGYILRDLEKQANLAS